MFVHHFWFVRRKFVLLLLVIFGLRWRKLILMLLVYFRICWWKLANILLNVLLLEGITRWLNHNFVLITTADCLFTCLNTMRRDLIWGHYHVVALEWLNFVYLLLLWVDINDDSLHFSRIFPMAQPWYILHWACNMCLTVLSAWRNPTSDTIWQYSYFLLNIRQFSLLSIWTWLLDDLWSSCIQRIVSQWVPLVAHSLIVKMQGSGCEIHAVRGNRLWCSSLVTAWVDGRLHFCPTPFEFHEALMQGLL